MSSRQEIKLNNENKQNCMEQYHKDSIHYYLNILDAFENAVRREGGLSEQGFKLVRDLINEKSPQIYVDKFRG